VCLPGSLYSPGQTIDTLNALNSAIIAGMKKLKPNDYVFLNLGNSSEILRNDKCSIPSQKVTLYWEPDMWKTVLEAFTDLDDQLQAR